MLHNILLGYRQLDLEPRRIPPRRTSFLPVTRFSCLSLFCLVVTIFQQRPKSKPHTGLRSGGSISVARSVLMMAFGWNEEQRPLGAPDPCRIYCSYH